MTTNPTTPTQTVQGVEAIISKGLNAKSIEKAALYVTGTAVATNIFGAVAISTDLKGVLIAGIAFVAAALHVSTPVNPKG